MEYSLGGRHCASFLQTLTCLCISFLCSGSALPFFPPYCCMANSIPLFDDVTSSVRPAQTPSMLSCFLLNAPTAPCPGPYVLDCDCLLGTSSGARMGLRLHPYSQARCCPALLQREPAELGDESHSSVSSQSEPQSRSLPAFEGGSFPRS